jgi:hypothetical protein
VLSGDELVLASIELIKDEKKGEREKRNEKPLI